MESIVPTSREHWLDLRLQDVTSTEVSALFGVNPYLTAFELWHQKRDKIIVDHQPSERMKWGLRLEDAIAKGIQEENPGWAYKRAPEYARIPSLRIGASFDFDLWIEEIIDDDPDCLLEIKNVDWLIFRDQWEEDEDGDFEAPAHIELQAQQQLLVKDRRRIVIGVLVGGNRVIEIHREPDREIQNQTKNVIAEFWSSIAQDKPPKPDFEKDAKFLAKLYGHAEPGKIIEATDAMVDVAMDYGQAADEEKDCKKRKAASKGQLLTLIGDAEKVLGERFTISAGLVGPKVVESFERKGFRDFRISFKKEKQNGK